MSQPSYTSTFPRIASVGVAGALVTFSDSLSEPVNRSAIAFQRAVETSNIMGLMEASNTLTSVFVGFDVTETDFATVQVELETLLGGQDWTSQPQPDGRKRWTIPMTIDGDAGPQWEEACALANLSDAQAREMIATTELRVLTLGFAPGQPYLGELPPDWNIPRQTALTGAVPAGAVVAAIRQITVFHSPAPTGWRQIGLTAVRLFQPNAPEPFSLRAGDTVIFDLVPRDQLEAMRADPNSNGGARAVSTP